MQRNPARPLPSGSGVVLPELAGVPQQRQALPDGRQALGHVVAQGVDRLERVGLRLRGVGGRGICGKVSQGILLADRSVAMKP